MSEQTAPPSVEATTAALEKSEPTAYRQAPPGTAIIGQPTYGYAHPDAVRALHVTAARRLPSVRVMQIECSLLAHGFNMLWCAALNQRRTEPGITYFAMLHGDIAPEPWWLDALVDELETKGADLVSCVVPIKNSLGLTSTALAADPDPRFEVERRLTMKEIMRLPVTFNAADLGFPNRALLVNTGCWVARLDRPWVEKVVFTINDRIVRDAHGNLVPQVEPEDWNLSRQLHALGAKVYATRRVALGHIGHQKYPNNQPWGEWEMDHDSPMVRPAVSREMMTPPGA